MIFSKEQIIKQIFDILTKLDKEHLVFLYNAEFMQVKGFRIVKLVKNEIIELKSSKKLENKVLIDIIISTLSEPNQNHGTAVIYNTLVKKGHLKYLGNNNYEFIGS